MLQSYYLWTVKTNGKFITIAEIDDIAFGKQILDYSFSMMLIFSTCKEYFNYCLPINCKDHQNRYANCILGNSISLKTYIPFSKDFDLALPVSTFHQS